MATEFMLRSAQELAENRRSQIVDAAARLFASIGYKAVSVDLIAAELGATKGVVYHYFKSKGEILAEVQLRAIRANHASLQEIQAAGGPPPQMLQKALRAHTLVALTHRYMARTYFAEQDDVPKALRPQIKMAAASVQAVVREILQRGMASGDFRSLPSQATVKSLLAMCNGPVNWYRSSSGMTEQQVADLCADLGLAAVLHPSAVRE